MSIEEALDRVDKEFGLYNQVSIEYAQKDGAMFAPLPDSVYDQADIDFLESKFKEYVNE